MVTKKKDTKIQEIPFIGYGDIQQQQNFLDPISEYSKKNNQIFKYLSTTTTGSSVLYTVPKGKVLFLSSVGIHQYNSSAVNAVTPSIYFSTENTISFLVVGPSETANLGKDLSVPIKIDENMQIGVNSYNGYFLASIIGWLEDKKQGAN